MTVLAFPNLSLEGKRKRLLHHNANLRHTERVGLLGDLLVTNKSNLSPFLKITGGMKFVYPEIARMTVQFPIIFLVDFFSQQSIPLKENADWKRYFWGAAWRTYQEWSARKAEQEHLERKMQEEPIAFIHRYIAERKK